MAGAPAPRRPAHPHPHPGQPGQGGDVPSLGEGDVDQPAGLNLAQLGDLGGHVPGGVVDHVPGGHPAAVQAHMGQAAQGPILLNLEDQAGEGARLGRSILRRISATMASSSRAPLPLQGRAGSTA